MASISDRHEGDLDGRLRPFAANQPVDVAIVVAAETAHLASTQHAAWMLINLLARAIGVVRRVRTIVESDAALVGRVVPLADPRLSLGDALVAGGQAIGVVPVESATAIASGDVAVIVGARARCDVPGARYVHADGWWGAVSDLPRAHEPTDSRLPFGPYVAACLAASEIFLDVRLPSDVARPRAEIAWDCWTQQLADKPSLDSFDEIDLTLPVTALAGVGAVGTAWIHAIWAIDGLHGTVILADPDLKGLEDSNLNRYAIFGRASLGRLKATEAASVAGHAAVKWEPHDRPFEQLSITPDLLISAVDLNRSREALQARYAPLVLSASTRDLRAEVLRVGPPGEGACLRCYNEPEQVVGDDDLRQQVRDGGDDAIHLLAQQASTTEDAVRQWLEHPRCDEVGDRLLTALRSEIPDQPPARFAVGFTSVMAGTLLAAETIKLLLGQPLTPTTPNANNIMFQFVRPTADTNSAGSLLRDPVCPACAQENPAALLWLRRSEGALRSLRRPDEA